MFGWTPDGLYVYKPTANFKNKVAELKETFHPRQVTNMIMTVKENSKGYTQRQFKNAKKARWLYHIIGCPTGENFKHILWQNIIKNCPVTADDVNIAIKLFGGNIGALKGKSTWGQPTPVKDDQLKIPPKLLQQHQDLTEWISYTWTECRWWQALTKASNSEAKYPWTANWHRNYIEYSTLFSGSTTMVVVVWADGSTRFMTQASSRILESLTKNDNGLAGVAGEGRKTCM
jgi:hypothetical protein